MLLDFIRKLPVSRLLLPYLAGILLFAGDHRLILSLLLLGLWGLLLMRMLEKRLPSVWPVRWVSGASLCCLWMGLGGLNMRLLNQVSSFPGEAKPFFAKVRIISLPGDKPKTIQCNAIVEQTGEDAPKWKGKSLQLLLKKDASSKSLGIGDELCVKLMPQLPPPPASTWEFDFASWLRRRGLCGSSYVSGSDWRLHSKASKWNVRAHADRIRTHLLEKFRLAGIDGPEYALVSALVLGEKNQLSASTKTDFSVSGISHLLSVSGLHVAVLYAVLALLLSFFDRFERWRVPKQVLLILLLFFYAFMTGLSPSVLRAAFMFSLLALGKCLHRKSQTLNTVLFSGFVLLLWNPGYIYDLGFQMSYLAVISIVMLHPPMVALWSPPNKVTTYLWEMICLSLVAQLGTSPLTVQAFHTFPNYFLLNNLIAVPFSSLLIYLALAFLMFSGWSWTASFLGGLLDAFLHGFLVMVETTRNLPNALTEQLYPNNVQLLAFYLILVFFYVGILLKRRRWIIPFMASILLFQVLYIGCEFW